jgi:bifunctional oligoribonuclease and PAP phosphatase NrnA
MDPHKLARQNSAIKKLVSELLEAEVKDPRIGFVTVTDVKLNRDQTVAEVFVSIMGERNDVTKTFTGLKKCKGFLQSRLSDILRMRATPDLRFIVDNSLDKSASVEDILAELAGKGEFMDESEKRKLMSLSDLIPSAELLDTLKESEDFWIVPHTNPDPDAMGSALALGMALKSMGKNVSVLGYNNPPAGFKDLPGFKKVLKETEAISMEVEDLPDVVVLVDCHRLERTGNLQDTLSRIDKKICIDHHLVSGRKMPLKGWVEPIASSTTMLVMRVIQELKGCKLTDNISTNLYAGLYADTGGFRYDNTLPMTHEAAYELTQYDFNPASIAESMLHRKSRAAAELQVQVMSTFSFLGDGKVLFMHTTQQMIKDTGTSMVDTEGFISMASGINGVQYVAYLKEQSDLKWRVSLRSMNAGDVQSVSAKFGGGGHRAAAGCSLTGDYDEVVEQLLYPLLELPVE